MKCRFFLFILIFLFPAASLGQSEGSLRLCMDEWPPYEYTKNGHPAGVSLDIVRAVLAQMGEEPPRVVVASWTRCLQNLKRGEDHAVITGLKSEERMEYSRYPEEPLLDSHWVFFVKRDGMETPRFKTLSDLKGKRIGVVKGFAYPPDFITYARNNARLEYGKDSMMNFRKLLNDRLDYVFEDVGPGMFGIRALNAEERITPILSAELASEPMYVMFCRAQVSDGFVKRFSDALREFKKTKHYERIMGSYMPLLEGNNQK